MVLEATMIVVDNSESSRNGDYIPTRWGAQSEAVSMIFNAKTNANPESSVGLMSMGGKGPEVLVTLTTDLGKVLDGMYRTKIWGTGHLSTGIAVAALALKHRQNKSQRQRIIVFTCSPLLDHDEKSLTKLARRMKKNNVSIDFVAFGDVSADTKTKLEAFNENVKGGEGSHVLFVPPGPKLLSDILITSPILAGEGGSGAVPSAAASGDTGGMVGADAGAAAGAGAGAGGAAGGGGGPGFEFGIDPSLDPELAMALRMSMEEETNRLERQRADRESEEQQKPGGSNNNKEDGTRLEGIPEEGGQGQISTGSEAQISSVDGGGVVGSTMGSDRGSEQEGKDKENTNPETKKAGSGQDQNRDSDRTRDQDRDRDPDGDGDGDGHGDKMDTA